MKPNFALSLSFEGISLLHRVPSGWHLVGEAALDSSDLAAELSVLRSTAQALDPNGLRSKLVIPNDQIRYLTLDTGNAAGDALQTRIREALDGATPYAVEDLAFDWRTEGGETRVAAVARETLEEAEAFAVEHKFQPISFVSVADDGAWEPFFGPTVHATSVIGSGESVEPDKDPLRIVGRARLPQPAAPAAAPAEPPEVAHKTEHKEAQTPEPSASEEAPDAAKADATPTPADAKPAREIDAAPEAEADTEPEAMPEPEADTAPESESVTFASVRARRDSPDTPAAPRLGGVARDDDPARAKGAAVSAPTLPDFDLPAARTAPRVATEDDADAAAARVADRTIASLRRPDPAEDATAPAATDAPSRRIGWRLPERGRTAKAAPAPDFDTDIDTVDSETQRMTVFGARNREATRGKPKFLGLILTVLLLLFLAGVAVWAAVDRDEDLAGWRTGTPLIVVETLPGETAEPEMSEVAVPAALPVQDGALMDDTGARDPGTDAVEMAALDLDEAAQPESDRPAPALAQPEPPAPITPDEADTQYAATGIWQMAPRQSVPPAIAGLQDLYIASIDPVVPEHDPVSLPRPDTSQTDLALRDPGTPPPAGTEFTFGADGLVIATPGGSVTPQGVIVFAGRPPLEPPVRQPDPDATTAESVEETVEQLRLAGFRPRLRPDDLVEQNERSQLGGLTRTELAGMRPRPRPEALKEAQEQDDAPPTAQAVAASVVPTARPGNIAAIVRRAEQTPEPVQTASVAPRSVTPSIPSSASVARQATVSNAINLRRINLIGVYGTPSKRRALVRLSNGRYQKVQVGDRIDGGRVAAIGDSELRYTKGGRSVVLRLPQG